MRDKRLFKSHEDVAASVKFDFSDSNCCRYREVTPVDNFYKQAGVSSDDGEKCVAYVDPIYMLLNQKRLQNVAAMGDSAIKAWFDSMQGHDASPLAQLRAQCSDSDLAWMIKSRHIQHPSEVQSWANYMSSHIDKFQSELSRVQSERIESEKENVESEKAAT